MKNLMKQSPKTLALAIVLFGLMPCVYAQNGGSKDSSPVTTGSAKSSPATAGKDAKGNQTGSNDSGNNDPIEPAPELMVNVQAKNSDVRDVLHDLFTQAKQNFIIDPNVHFVLWLTLNNTGFDQALDIICNEAHLQYKKEDGIWKISIKPTPAMLKAEAKLDSKKTAVDVKEIQIAAEKKAPPKPTFTERDLARKITTRMSKASIRLVYEELSKQAKIPIFVDAKVPEYKVDAFLIHTSLHYALTKLDEAAGLKYKLASDGIHVFLAHPLLGVTLDK